ncbi:hypothetical protein EDD68_11522 [Melghiribacillus thermohalophilus]|uniref:Uncharacterized protein n=1 Tax=Melghiribacillus thermohalophilus TaxID=1324956 RepID=A0A4V2V174_9BACI|nr:hypothetical protein [Melghiribacillus thermohalophilus]TCT19972.1 hypothetical protein EDD68_11522 [Melghiribacillus thermohalophilus]
MRLDKTNQMKQKKEDEPVLAPGIDDDEELDQKASKEDIKKGNYTRVVHLSYDEVGPSGEGE